MPVILMEQPKDNYWQAWDKFIKKQLLAKGFVNAEDLSFYRIAHSPEEGVELVKDYYSTFNSVRQVQDKLVIRMERELTAKSINILSTSFPDIIKDGKIIATLPLPGEESEPGLWVKPRISFVNNKKSAGRLNQMIQMINSLGRSS